VTGILLPPALERAPSVVAAATRPAGRRSRHAAVALVVLGVYLVVTPFALSLFSRTRDAETLAHRYRDFATEDGLAQFSEHTEIVVDGGEQLLAEGLPSFARNLGMSNAEFSAYLDARYPALSVYRRRAPEVFGYLTPAVARTAAQADAVADADDFPVPGVPVTAGPWALLGAGLVLTGTGLWFLSGRGAAATIVALVAGVGLVAGPIVAQWPHEIDAAEQVAEAARVAFTPAVAQATTSDTAMIDAAVLELRQALLPAVGAELGLSPSEVDAMVVSDLPATGRFLREWDDGLSAAARELSLSQLQYMDEFHHADATPYRALPWLFVVPGVLVLVVVAGAAVLDRGRSGA
jgi:hypothetical protein